jgi:hypothetical protein
MEARGKGHHKWENKQPHGKKEIKKIKKASSLNDQSILGSLKVQTHSFILANTLSILHTRAAR